ncbi:MAG: hypothetical protein ACRCSN_04280 [Dermatophilaceae bacterium]
MVDPIDTAPAPRVDNAATGAGSGAPPRIGGLVTSSTRRGPGAHVVRRQVRPTRERTLALRRAVAEPTPTQPRRVTEAKAIRCLVDAEHLMYLGAFIGEEQSVAKAARELGVPFARAYVRVRTLERVGLLRRHRLQRRKGRPITTYVATSEEFDIPLSVLFGTREVGAVENRWHDRFVRSLEQQALRHLKQNPDGSLRVTKRAGRLGTELVHANGQAVSVDDPAVAPVSWGWTPLRLLEDDARELRREIDVLRERYYTRHQACGSPFVLGLHLAPIDD